MNWPRRLQISLLIWIAVGVFIGAVVGYFVIAAQRGANGFIPFGKWITLGSNYSVNPYPWFLLGGLIGGAVAYAITIRTAR
jgi:H+/Cl- antiporter ClcA